MMFLHSLLIIYVYSNVYIDSVQSQTTGHTSSDGRYYICVNPGTCPTEQGGTIDPRIVTPGNGNGNTGNECPAGTVPCYGINTQCGSRNVSNPSTSDGIATPGAWPWQAFLRSSGSGFIGSGVLLDERHVLTAAHKVENYAPNSITVVMGVYDPRQINPQTTQISTVAAISIQPNYDRSPTSPKTLKNDIAVLTLATPIVMGVQTTVNKACLPNSFSSYIGRTCVVAGWGQSSFTTNDAPTNPMKQVYVNIVDYNTCRTSMAQSNVLGSNANLYLDPQGEICAGGERNKDACTQDGGSPLMCPDARGNYNIAGLVIWGKNCGQPGVYGVYVNVPYYSNWITGIVTTT